MWCWNEIETIFCWILLNNTLYGSWNFVILSGCRGTERTSAGACGGWVRGFESKLRRSAFVSARIATMQNGLSENFLVWTRAVEKPLGIYQRVLRSWNPSSIRNISWKFHPCRIRTFDDIGLGVNVPCVTVGDPILWRQIPSKIEWSCMNEWYSNLLPAMLVMFHPTFATDQAGNQKLLTRTCKDPGVV